MTIINNKLKFIFFILFLGHFFFSVKYSLKVPFNGDEWSSYQNFTIMALPFSLIVSFLKFVLGPISVENYLLYRQQGILFTGLIYVFLYQFSSKHNEKFLSEFAIYLTIFITFNPFILQTSQFFRYYQLYIFFSIIFTMIILEYDASFINRRNLFYLMMVSSIFIHLFILIQMFTYILFKELFIIKKNIKLLYTGIFGVLFIIIILNHVIVLDWLRNSFFPVYLFPGGNETSGLRGYSISSLIKPFMIFFTHMFARNLTPLSYNLLDICYIISGISIIYGTMIFMKHKPSLIKPLFFSGIFPFILCLYVLEPFSLVGFPQLVPQHVIFVLPWIAYIFFILWKFHHFGLIINAILFCGFIYAGILHQKMEFVDWAKIEKVINPSHTIITDNKLDTEFFLKNKEFVPYTSSELVNDIIKSNDTLSIIFSNWKIYQDIQPMQFWHNPNGTNLEFNAISSILSSLADSSFSLYDGYSFFPYHVYTFVKNKKQTTQNLWLYDLKYRDLKIPIIIEDKKIIGFEKIDLNQPVYIDSVFYYFIQNNNNNNKTGDGIEKIFVDGTKKIYQLNQEKDDFRANHCRSLNNDKIISSFKKFPLVSNSMKYKGSIRKSEIRIFKHKEIETNYSLKGIKPGQILIKAIVSNL